MSRIQAAVFGGLGGAVVLGLGLLVGGSSLRGDAGVAGSAGAAGPEDIGANAVLLVREAAACPAGWVPGGQVRILTSPDYALSGEQTGSNPGVMTTSTMDWSNVNFFLCARSTE